jgi:hypothetical protein
MIGLSEIKEGISIGRLMKISTLIMPIFCLDFG